MRDGQYIGTWDIGNITIDQLISQMVGRDMQERFPPREGERGEEVLLNVEHLTSANPRSFRDVSFELKKGEILGLGGLVGAQRTELVESIFGLRKIAGGTMTVRMLAKCAPNEQWGVQRELRERAKLALDAAGIRGPQLLIGPGQR